jgi:hypothetical protein
MAKNVRSPNRINVVINFAMEEFVNLHPLVEEIVKEQKLESIVFDVHANKNQTTSTSMNTANQKIGIKSVASVWSII